MPSLIWDGNACFRSATFYYDGGVLAFDPSNRITDCVLRLGPHVDRESAGVQELIARFPWTRVLYGDPLSASPVGQSPK
jgi:hypothetical protein